MAARTIRQVRAFVARGGGADYHDQSGGHWIDDHLATPMSLYPQYRQSRQSFGVNVLGTLVVEIEADDGPLLNMASEVIGINTAGKVAVGQRQRPRICVPVNEMKYVAQTLIRDGRITHPTLGLTAQSLNDSGSGGA